MREINILSGLNFYDVTYGIYATKEDTAVGEKKPSYGILQGKVPSFVQIGGIKD